MEFQEFRKIPRLSREVIITEKIDGTNAQIFIETWNVGEERINALNYPYTFAIDNKNGTTTYIFAGSRTRWITPENDNYGFARWVKDNANELIKLGPGRHFGEWWGNGIQRKYGLKEKRFSLFNTSKWTSELNINFTGLGSTICNEVPVCHVVPLIGKGIFNTQLIDSILHGLESLGSFASPGFNDPEGIVIYHVAGDLYFKKTIKNDESPKSLVK